MVGEGLSTNRPRKVRERKKITMRISLADEHEDIVSARIFARECHSTGFRDSKVQLCIAQLVEQSLKTENLSPVETENNYPCGASLVSSHQDRMLPLRVATWIPFSEFQATIHPQAEKPAVDSPRPDTRIRIFSRLCHDIIRGSARDLGLISPSVLKSA